MDEDQKANLEEESRRGDQARQVMNNPVFREALLMMKADLLSGFEQSGAKQDDERKELWRMIRTLNKFEAQLTDIMQTGELAKKSLMQKIFNR